MKRIIFSAAIVISTIGLVATQAPASFATATRLGTVKTTTVGLDQKTVTLTPPTSNSPGTWVISVADPTIASVNGLTLTLLKAGSTQITYTQQASGSFNSDFRMAVLIVQPGTPVIGAWAPLHAALSAGTFTIPAPVSTSNGSWFYSLSNNSVAGHPIATVSGSTVTLDDAGTVAINATQYATGNWKSTTATTTLTITAITPIVGTFTDITIAKDSISSVTLISPTSTSSGTWQFTSSDSSIASISGSTLTPLNVGQATITAYQAPVNGYSSARATMTVTVTAAAPAVGAFASIAYTLGSIVGNTLTLTNPTSNSPGAWSFSVGDPTIASVSGNLLTVVKAGTTTITATQQASGNYGLSAPQTVALVVNVAPTYTVLPNLSQVVGDPARTITPPTSPSSGAWTMSSSDSTIASVNGLSLAFGNAGTATITLSQAAAGAYLAGKITFTVSVAGLVPTLATFAPITIGVGDKVVSIPNPTSNSTGTWSYSVADPTIASLVNGVLVGIKAGKTMISATQAPAGKYGQSNTVQAVLTVLPAPTVGSLPNLSLVAGAAAASIANPSSDSTGAWTFQSADSSVITVNGSSITPVAAGKAVVIATQAATPTFGDATVSFTVTVSAAPKPAAAASPAPAKTKPAKPVVKKSSTKKSTTKKVATKKAVVEKASSAVVPVVTVSSAGHAIKVAAKGGAVVVTINGAPAKVGSNTVKAGDNLVIVEFDNKVIYSRVITIK